MLDVVGKKRWFFGFSALLTVPGLIFIALTFLTSGTLGLQFSIDYTGGTLWEIRFDDDSVTAEDVKATLVAEGVEDVTVVSTSGGYLMIRTAATGLQAAPAPSPTAEPSPSPAASPDASAGAVAPSPTPAPTAAPAEIPIPTSGRLGELATALQAEHGKIADQRELTSVGAVVSGDLINQAILLIIVGSLAILAWITIRFRDVKFGIAAIVALVHDVVVVLGTFAILGTLFGIQIDALFVSAMLTIIGFSVHDSIVVFDRVRENKARHAGESIAAIVNHSILQTFGRSINTSLTVVITLTALLLFSGSAITYFVLALLIGIISGTYSSIFNAAPIVVVWQEWEDRRRAARLAAARGTRRASA
ncbi:MAG: protein translocase subunit SecF [Chloroflexota bacterium]